MKAVAIALLAAAAFAVHAVSATEPAADRKADAAAVCAQKSAHPRYQHPSDACWIAFDLALTRNAVQEAIAAVRMGCERYGRADQCLLASWIAAPQRALRPVSYRGGGLTATQLARMADDIGAWEWDDAMIGLVARENTLKVDR